jgi:hypothetical protein
MAYLESGKGGAGAKAATKGQKRQIREVESHVCLGCSCERFLGLAGPLYRWLCTDFQEHEADGY